MFSLTSGEIPWDQRRSRRTQPCQKWTNCFAMPPSTSNPQSASSWGLKVGDFWLVPGLGQNFETVLDKLGCAAAENSLFTEQIGFGLLGEGRSDSTSAQGSRPLA